MKPKTKVSFVNRFRKKTKRKKKNCSRERPVDEKSSSDFQREGLAERRRGGSSTSSVSGEIGKIHPFGRW